MDEEYKLQARTNIGALSTADVDTVLQQAKDSGQFDGKDGDTPVKGVDYFDGKDGYTPVKGKDYFDGYTPVKGKDYFDGANGKSAYAYAQDGGYTGTEAEFAAKLASDSEPLVVTLSGNDTDGYTADKTVAEIYAARTAGRDVYMVGGAVTYQLSYLNGSFAAFSYTMASRNAIEIISVIMMSGVAPTRIHQTIDDSYVKYTAQSLDEEYKLQARTNIGAAAAADLSKYVTTGTAQTITGVKTFNAPANVASTEQHTVKFKTSNGGAIIFGKEAANSGTMLRFDQVDGTTRLRFRGSDSAGAIVWEQPEQGAQLYIDLGKQGVDKHRISFPSSGGTLALTSQIPSLSGYLPLSGGLMTGPLKFQAASLPGKTLQYICGVDAFANGGEMGWQSKADFLSGYLTTTGTAARATADANGNNIANTYAKVTTANDYNGEQRFKNATYCPTITDTASGIGCAFKASRGMVNELLADKIIATASTGKIPFYSYTGASNGSMTGLTEFAYLSPGAFILRPPSGEGGQIQLEAAANDPTNTGICIDTAGGNFRIFGLQSADGTTTTGYGSVLAIHPYAKIITGGYSFDGLAAKATADGNGRNIVSTYATKNEVVTAANGSFKVTLSGNDTDGYTVDKTFAEIKTAWEAGRYVYVTNGVIVCNLCYFSTSIAAVFTYTRATGNGVEVWSVMVNNLGTKPTVVKKTITA